MAAGESAGIILRIKADSAQAQTQLKAFKKDLKEIEKATKDQLNPLEQLAARSGVTAAQFDNLKVGALAAVGAIGAVAGAVGAVTAVAAGAAVALFKLASSTAEFGSEIFDASQKTGLGAVAISSLKVAADQSGASLETVTGGIARFAKTVGAAGEDAKKAAVFVKDFGITPQAALNDLDGALGKVFKRIYDAKPGVEQMTLAQKAFGRSGADLIPVINATGGSLEAFKKKCEELGVTIDDKTAAAADAFGDQMDMLNAQLAGVGRTIGTALLPVFTDMANAMSRWLASNQGQIKQWAQTSGFFISGVADYWTRAASAVNGYVKAVQNAAGGQGSTGAKVLAETAKLVMFGPSYPILKGTEFLAGKAVQRGKELEAARPKEGMGGAPSSYEPDSFTGGGARDTRAADAEKRAREAEQRVREAEQLAKRNLRAGIAAATNNLGQGRDDIGISLDAMIEKLREFGTSDKSVAKIAEEFDQLAANTAIYLKALEKLEDQERDTNTEAENSLLTQEQRMRRDKEEAVLEKAREEFKKGVAELDKERYERADKAIEREIEQTKELMRLEEEREANKLAAPPLNRPEMALGDTQPGFWNSISESIGKYLEGVVLVRDANGLLEFSFTQTFSTIKDMGLQAFAQLAQGFGQLVANWVLYGNEAEGGMRKMLAGVLANLASMATTYAIMCLAAAALATTVWGMALLGGTPTQFLLAAALFGAVAAGTALAGRAVAGDSFKKESGRATGGAGGTQEGQGNAPGLNFTERFAGFQQQQNQQMAQMQDRTNAVLGGVIDAVTKFNNKFGVTTPDAVVMAGAGGASSQIFDAVQEHKSTDLRGSTQDARNDGRYR